MKLRMEPIPGQRTHHGKCATLLSEVRANGTGRRPCWDERRLEQQDRDSNHTNHGKDDRVVSDTIPNTLVMVTQ